MTVNMVPQCRSAMDGSEAMCLVCGGESTAIGVRNGYRYDRCHVCGLYFVHPRPSWDAIKSWYGPSYYRGGLVDDHGHVVGYDNYDTQGPVDAERLFQWLRIHGPDLRGTRVLDVGCARGYLVRLLQEAGAVVEGVEQSADAIRYLSERRIRVHPSLEAATASRPFDGVVMAEYLEHVLDPKKDLQMAHACLKPQGWLAMTVPNGNQCCVQQYGVAYHSFTAPVHLQVFTMESLAQAIKGLFVLARYEAYCLNLQNPIPRTVLHGLGITDDRIRFDGTIETYDGLGPVARMVLKGIRAYRFYVRRQSLELNMGLRLLLRRV